MGHSFLCPCQHCRCATQHHSPSTSRDSVLTSDASHVSATPSKDPHSTIEDNAQSQARLLQEFANCQPLLFEPPDESASQPQALGAPVFARPTKKPSALQSNMDQCNRQTSVGRQAAASTVSGTSWQAAKCSVPQAGFTVDQSTGSAFVRQGFMQRAQQAGSAFSSLWSRRQNMTAAPRPPPVPTHDSTCPPSTCPPSASTRPSTDPPRATEPPQTQPTGSVAPDGCPGGASHVTQTRDDKQQAQTALGRVASSSQQTCQVDAVHSGDLKQVAGCGACEQAPELQPRQGPARRTAAGHSGSSTVRHADRSVWPTADGDDPVPISEASTAQPAARNSRRGPPQPPHSQHVETAATKTSVTGRASVKGAKKGSAAATAGVKSAVAVSPKRRIRVPSKRPKATAPKVSPRGRRGKAAAGCSAGDDGGTAEGTTGAPAAARPRRGGTVGVRYKEVDDEESGDASSQGDDSVSDGIGEMLKRGDAMSGESRDEVSEAVVDVDDSSEGGSVLLTDSGSDVSMDGAKGAQRRQRGRAASGTNKEQQPKRRVVKGKAQRTTLGDSDAECDGNVKPRARPVPRKTAGGGGKKSPPPAKRTAKPQQRQNFVKMNLGKRGGSYGNGRKFMARGFNKNSRNKRFGRFQGAFNRGLKMAGEGADIMEGTRGRAPRYVCFKCGQPGHWAKECTNAIDLDAKLQKMEGAPSEAEPSLSGQAATDVQQGRPQQGAPGAPTPAPTTTIIVKDYSHVGQNPDESSLTAVLQEVWGHSNFRGTQLPVIQKILAGTSTLAIMPTGAGKSLCYQLPALLLPGVTLVVSPLIALMRDQLSKLPPQLPAAMLWGGQTRSDSEHVLKGVKTGALKVLFVAPERLHSTPLIDALHEAGELSLVCVDEAHCVTEWGHNFRPAYFRLGYALRSRLHCRCVLGLTATATKTTEASVASVLGISAGNIIRGAYVRDNLRLAVTRLTGGGDSGVAKRAVLQLFRSGPLRDAPSAIVYCTFQSQTDDVAKYLYVNGITAQGYHAGKPMKERESVQAVFLTQRIRVVVATVAFGMGIDAQGVRGVVHLTMPRSVEDYVQQVGRAGRDGAPAHCHVLLDDRDFLRLRSLAHSDTAAKESVTTFLKVVFDREDEDNAQRGAKKRKKACRGSVKACAYRVVSIKQLVSELDVKEEIMETALSYLEADDPCYLQVLPTTVTAVRVAFYDVPPEDLAEQHPAIAALLCCCRKARNGCYTAQMNDLTAELGASPYTVVSSLQRLAVSEQLRIEMCGDNALAFKVLRHPDDIDALAQRIAERLSFNKSGQVGRLDAMYRTLAAASVESEPLQQEHVIVENLGAYFEGRPLSDAAASVQLPVKRSHEMLEMDIRALVTYMTRSFPDVQITPLAMARILHGLSSPAYPADTWSKYRDWGSKTDVDFQEIMRVAALVLKKQSEEG